MTPARVRVVALAVALAFVVVAAGGACTRSVGDARDLAVSSDVAARAVFAAALAALARGDEAAVLARFCDTSDDGLARARELLRPALRRGDLLVERVEPAWVGAEPYFLVEVRAGDDSWRHGFGVRARDGCLDRAVGAAPPADADSAVIDL
ncbi:MAG: hypothetical protein FJ137_01715 [Deltaproteobacteria bacterium]|nr:hypothetical protein [Deltaproteobacteria bacterium]